MTEPCARAILRLIALTTMLIGLCLTVFTFIIQVGASKTVAGLLTQTMAPMGTYTMLAYLSIVGLGLALFALSSKLAVFITE